MPDLQLIQPGNPSPGSRIPAQGLQTMVQENFDSGCAPSLYGKGGGPKNSLIPSNTMYWEFQGGRELYREEIKWL